jgi:hypothetical protein
MSSIHSDLKQMPANVLYTNVADCSAAIFKEDGVTVAAWISGSAAALGLTASYGAVFRDMGKTIYHPTEGALRKIQVVPNSATALGLGDAATYLSGYIKLGGALAPATPRFVRMC